MKQPPKVGDISRYIGSLLDDCAPRCTDYLCGVAFVSFAQDDGEWDNIIRAFEDAREVRS